MSLLQICFGCEAARRDAILIGVIIKDLSTVAVGFGSIQRRKDCAGLIAGGEDLFRHLACAVVRGKIFWRVLGMRRGFQMRKKGDGRG